MKKIFILFLLLLNFSLLAIGEIPSPLSAPTSEVITDHEDDQCADNESDPSLKKKDCRCTIVAQNISSPLMMFSRPKLEEEKNASSKNQFSTADFSAQQRRNIGSQSSSLAISRSQKLTTVSENKSGSLLKPALPQEASSLFRTLIYCPGCKQWHTAANISKQPLPQILFVKNLQTGYWNPIHREDQKSKTSLLQKALPYFSFSSSIGEKNFQLLPDSYQQDVLHHINPSTGKLEKSLFQDPINQLPDFTDWIAILLQLRPLIPDSIAQPLIMRILAQKQHVLPATSLAGVTERTLLLPKDAIPISYSSTSTQN